MPKTSSYTPPKVWQNINKNGGKWSNINRPTAGATHEKELPVGKHPLQLYSLATPNGVPQGVTKIPRGAARKPHRRGISRSGQRPGGGPSPLERLDFLAKETHRPEDPLGPTGSPLGQGPPG